MVWEKRFLLGGITGWEHMTTHDLIFVQHKAQWEVVLNNKSIHTAPDELEATCLMSEYMDTH